MIARPLQTLAAAVVVITMAAVPARAAGQPAAQPLPLLDVPYLPQTVALCGGAATAMVMRFWGATGIYAESFADLVVPEAGGIRGEDLLTALRARGWEARSFRGDAALVQAQLHSRRPVVALIEDRPGQFHYVVIVGWAHDRVIAHDPARAPFRVFQAHEFEAAWSKSGHWTMLALPGAAGESRPAREGAGERSFPDAVPAPCSGMVEEAIRLAGADAVAEARQLLELAAAACPLSAAPWRELAGIEAVQEDWAAAAAHARLALAREPGDEHAWRILATSLFLQDDPDGALAAWNQVGEPVIDLVDIKGLDRTRFAVAMRAINLSPQTPLTADALRRARLRLAQLPSAQVTRVAYRPMADGQAEVSAVVLERPMLPTSPLALLGTGINLVTDRELAVAISSPTGGGEVWRAAWRWWANRPRLALDFRAPAPFGGVWGVSAFTERQSYRTGMAPDIIERRQGVVLSASRWMTSGTRLDAAAGFDRWNDARRAGSLSIGAHQRLLQGTAFIEGEGSVWAGELRTWTASARAEWRSSPRNEGQVVVTRGGLLGAGADAPRALWSGAGSGQGREPLLRAHSLLDDGVVTSGIFGRGLAHTSVEVRRWTQLRTRPVRLAPAVFIDTARAWQGGVTLDPRWHVDAGAGLRVALPGAGVLRLDLARGLRDGRTALSIAVTR